MAMAQPADTSATSTIPYKPTCFQPQHPATTQIYTLTLHDALPIYSSPGCLRWRQTTASCGNRSTRADRKSTRLNSSHVENSYAVFCLKKKIQRLRQTPRSKRRVRCSDSKMECSNDSRRKRVY